VTVQELCLLQECLAAGDFPASGTAVLWTHFLNLPVTLSTRNLSTKFTHTRPLILRAWSVKATIARSPSTLSLSTTNFFYLPSPLPSCSRVRRAPAFEALLAAIELPGPPNHATFFSRGSKRLSSTWRRYVEPRVITWGINNSADLAAQMYVVILLLQLLYPRALCFGVLFNWPCPFTNNGVQTSDPSPLDAIREQTSKIEDWLDTISEPLKPYVEFWGASMIFRSAKLPLPREMWQLLMIEEEHSSLLLYEQYS
jgi:hypothetical protein